MNTLTTAKQQIYTISQLNQISKEILEIQLGTVMIEGEISNLSRPGSGHIYFSLKDSNAQVRCAMFKGYHSKLEFKPESGQQVLVKARVSIYPARGDYQLIIETMQPAGVGNLEKQFQQLKVKLQKQGLFEPSRKKAIPSNPKQIGLITSPTGAAVYDMLTVLKRRYPLLNVIIYPTTVQGNQAASQIVNAIKIANQRNECDLLIVSRGGGSIEDLWPFNEEVVAHAIAVSELPIISAVGHEVDFTIADFVADIRAATPSAGAELASPDIQVQLQQLKQTQHDLIQAIDQLIQLKQNQVNQLKNQLPHPKQKLTQQMQLIDQMELRLKQSIQNIVKQKQLVFNLAKTTLRNQSPLTKLNQYQQHVAQLTKQLQQTNHYYLNQKQNQLNNLASVLHSASPLTLLDRGYAVVTDQGQKTVKDINQIQIGDPLNIRVKSGHINAQVTNIEPLVLNEPADH